MKAEKGDLRSFSREQCLALVASVPIGRVVYTDQALPAVIPMNFVLDDDEIVIRTGSGSVLAAAIRDAVVVAFQVDDFDSDTTTGWSVTITGRAWLVDGGEEATRLARLPFRPLVPAKSGQFIRIPIRHVVGHRFGAARIDAPNGGGAQDRTS